MTEIYCEAKKHLHFAGPPLDCEICRWKDECVVYGRLRQARQLVQKKIIKTDKLRNPDEKVDITKRQFVEEFNRELTEILGVLGDKGSTSGSATVPNVDSNCQAHNLKVVGELKQEDSREPAQNHKEMFKGICAEASKNWMKKIEGSMEKKAQPKTETSES